MGSKTPSSNYQDLISNSINADPLEALDDDQSSSSTGRSQSVLTIRSYRLTTITPDLTIGSHHLIALYWQTLGRVHSAYSIVTSRCLVTFEFHWFSSDFHFQISLPLKTLQIKAADLPRFTPVKKASKILFPKFFQPTVFGYCKSSTVKPKSQ